MRAPAGAATRLPDHGRLCGLVVMRPTAPPLHPQRIVEQILPIRQARAMQELDDVAIGISETKDLPAHCHSPAARTERWMHDDRCDRHASMVIPMDAPRMRWMTRPGTIVGSPARTPLAAAQAGSVSRARRARCSAGSAHDYRDHGRAPSVQRGIKMSGSGTPALVPVVPLHEDAKSSRLRRS